MYILSPFKLLASPEDNDSSDKDKSGTKGEDTLQMILDDEFPQDISNNRPPTPRDRNNLDELFTTSQQKASGPDNLSIDKDSSRQNDDQDFNTRYSRSKPPEEPCDDLVQE